MAPDTLLSERLSWCDDPPWPGTPSGIAVARLAFSAADLQAANTAFGIPLPPSIAGGSSKRRSDYIAGRLCARRVLRSLTGRERIPGRSTEGAPLWPSGLTGSISHAEGTAIALASQTARHLSLGVDVERLMTSKQAETLAPLILTDSERNRFASMPQTLLTTAAFSLKEALFKALHPLTRIMFFHEHAELLALEPEGRAVLRLLVSLGPDWQTGASLVGCWHCSGSHIFSLIATGPK